MTDIQTKFSTHPKTNDITKIQKKVDEAAKDFEAMFISKMLNIVFDQIEPNSITGGGDAEKMLKSLLVDEYAKAVAKEGSTGIADFVRNEINKIHGEKNE